MRSACGSEELCPGSGKHVKCQPRASDRMSFYPPRKRYVDGGVTDNMPFLDAKTTILVSPFYGEYDICPKVTSTNFLHVDISKLSIRLCSENAYLLSCVICPPDLKVRRGPCSGGRLRVPGGLPVLCASQQTETGAH